jgi:hypothetical protein
LLLLNLITFPYSFCLFLSSIFFHIRIHTQFFFYLFYVIFKGYGDIFPETVPAKILTSIIVLLGFSLIPAQVSGERNDMVIEKRRKEKSREW